ncbi:MAG: PDGLE domain-containing protein [Methanobacterium sp.]|uniref:PDGLE domain-containing protein n=1 Tax=Methanobacterium sp. TaxID=2164 RepID=UPI003C74AC01
MNTTERNLLIGGLIIALIIGVLSPFIASTQPDGLTASAMHLNPNVLVNPGYWHAPFDNYEIKQLGGGYLSGIVALVIGVFIALGFVYVVTEILKRRNKTDN